MARPDNPASVIRQAYVPIFVRKVAASHKAYHHSDVNIHRRISSNGSSESLGTGWGGSDLQDGDVLRFDEDRGEWVPGPGSGTGGTVDMTNHSHQSEENGDGGYVPHITE